MEGKAGLGPQILQIPEQVMQYAVDSLVYHCRKKKQNIIIFSYAHPCPRKRAGKKDPKRTYFFGCELCI